MPRLGSILAVLVLIGLSLSAGGVGASPSEGDGIASIREIDDLVLGESEQTFEAMRIAGFDEDADRLTIQIDLSVLQRHGVGVSEAGVAVSEAAVDGASVASAQVQDGVVTLVLTPAATGIFVSEFRITGLNTSTAQVATDLRYDVTFSSGAAEGPSFDLVDPADVSPQLAAETLVLADDSQWVTLERVRPTGSNVTIELNATILHQYGIGLDQASIEVRTDEAQVLRTAVHAGTFRIVLSPHEDTVLFDVRLRLTGFNTSMVDSDERTIASDVRYQLSLDGVATDAVDHDPFDVVRNAPSPHVDSRSVVTDDPTRSASNTATISDHGPDLWPVGVLVGLVVIAILAERRGMGPG